MGIQTGVSKGRVFETGEFCKGMGQASDWQDINILAKKASMYSYFLQSADPDYFILRDAERFQKLLMFLRLHLLKRLMPFDHVIFTEA